MFKSASLPSDASRAWSSRKPCVDQVATAVTPLVSSAMCPIQASANHRGNFACCQAERTQADVSLAPTQWHCTNTRARVHAVLVLKCQERTTPMLASSPTQR